jgi:hypothetical protein
VSDFFASGRFVDLALLLVAAEAVILVLWRRRGRGPARAGLFINLASGACLMLAVRAAVTGASWTWLALALAAAGAAHVADLWLRLRPDAR